MCQAKETIQSDNEVETTTEEEEEYDPDNEMILRAKWCIDDSRTLDEVVEHLQSFIEYVKKLKEDGWELTEVIRDDYGYLARRPRE